MSGRREHESRYESVGAQVDMYTMMVRIRKFEETVADLYTKGQMVGLAHLYIGQEAVAAGVGAALEDRDVMTSTHRGHGHLLAKGGDPKRMFAEILGRRDGYNRGKGGSMHVADFSIGFLGANGIVGASIGLATGAGLAIRYRNEDRVAVAFFGDGALNSGILYESLNLAAIWKLPVVFVCENNQYGEYSRVSEMTAGSITARAQAMGIAAETIDGNDPGQVARSCDRARLQAAHGLGPSFIECQTYRLKGHHMGDTGNAYGYRTNDEITAWAARDPIGVMRSSLSTLGVDADHLAQIDESVGDELAVALSEAMQSPHPDLSELATDVYV